MTRGLGIVSLVVSLVISLMLFSSQLTRGGSKPASPKENPIVQQDTPLTGANETCDAVER